MYGILILGILNCLTYTLTQSPFSKFLEDCDRIFWILPSITIPYFLRFLYDKKFYHLFNRLFHKPAKAFGYHKVMVVLLAFCCFLLSFLSILLNINPLIYAFLFSLFGSLQTNVIENYKMTLSSLNKQSSLFLFGYRSCKIFTTTIICYPVYLLNNKYEIFDRYLSYRLSFLLTSFLILLIAIIFFFISKKTDSYNPSISFFNKKKVKYIFYKIKNTQGFVSFFSSTMFRAADSMTSYVYLNFITMFILESDIAVVSSLSTLVAILGIYISYNLKKYINTKSLVMIVGILQSLSILSLMLMPFGFTVVIVIACLFKFVGSLNTDVICSIIIQNSKLVKNQSQSIYMISQSYYRFISIIYSQLGSLIYFLFSYKVFFICCFILSILPMLLYSTSLKSIKQL